MIVASCAEDVGLVAADVVEDMTVELGGRKSVYHQMSRAEEP